MKRSEMMAWTALVGLLAIGILLLVGGCIYETTTFWAGMLMAFGQALVVGLAAWGLSLARQRAELQDFTPVSATEGFRMSYAGESDAGPMPLRTDSSPEIKTLDTSFQRMVVGITAAVLIVMAVGICYLIYTTFGWAKAHLDQPFPITRSFDKPKILDPLALVIGLGAAVAYFILYSITRPRRGEGASAEAVSSNFTLGIAGMIALGVATIGGWLKVTYSAEVAASIIAALLLLQGLELLVNAFRSYSAVEELDEEAVDLHALPLVPMLSSVWLSGLKILFAQSVGLSAKSEGGVIARMMPRAIGASIVIAILVSCLRVVPPGEVAVLERLGYAPQETGPDGARRLADSTLLKPGLHLTLPWPIDTLVAIPKFQLQQTNVGAELHAPKSGETAVDFQFWTVRANDVTEGEDNEDQFVTGDPAPQMLETYVTVMWRVSDPSKFYTGLSHSEFFFKGKGNEQTQAMPIYEALVQQATGFAVTRTFAIHTLDEIMTYGRSEVEGHCKRILQEKLDAAGSGIEVVDLTIKDLHPPLGKGLQPDPSNPADPWKRGPAHAYENVTSMREYKETLKDIGDPQHGHPGGEAYKTALINLAQGDYASRVNAAQAYKAETIARAQGEAARLQATMAGSESLSPLDQSFMVDFAERQAMYRTLNNVFTPVNKIILDPRIKDITLYQSSEKSAGGPQGPRPPGQ